MPIAIPLILPNIKSPRILNQLPFPNQYPLLLRLRYISHKNK